MSALNLTHPNYPIWEEDESSNGIPRGVLQKLDKFWQHLLPAPSHGENGGSLPHIPALVNTTAFNSTLAEEKLGSWDWNRVEGWELSVKEREIIERDDEGEVIELEHGQGDDSKTKTPKKEAAANKWSDWAWVHVRRFIPDFRCRY